MRSKRSSSIGSSRLLGRRARSRRPLLALAAVVFAALLADLPAEADVTFSHASGFGTATTIQGQANSSLQPLPSFIGPRDAGGEHQRFLISDGQAATPSGAGRIFLTSTAHAGLGTMGGFIRADSVNHYVGGNQVFEDGNGSVRSKFYNSCTLESDTLPTGTPVTTALSWKLNGTFSHTTPGFNFFATLFVQALQFGSPGFGQVETSVVVVSSQQSRVDLHDELALPGITVGDSFILEPFLDVFSGSPPFTNETFIADFDASVLPIVTTPETDAHWKCAAINPSRLAFAQWEHDHCTDPTVPQQELTAAILPVRARGAAPGLAFDQVVERIQYLKDYYFQQSLCSVRLHAVTVRDPDTDGWMELPRTQAEYESIPTEFGTRATFQRNFNIGADAFAVAYEKDSAFLLNQQLGALDAVLVVAAPFSTLTKDLHGLTASALAKGIVTDPDVNAFAGGAAAFVASSVLGPSCLLSPVTVEACFAAGGPLAVFVGTLKQTLLLQGFAIATNENPTEIWAHELAHGLFTYWDFYGTPEPFVRGDIGRWGLMGDFNGDNPPSPIVTYNKAIQGWVTYRDIPAGDWGADVLKPFGSLRFGDRVPRYKPPRGFYDWLIFELRTPPDGVPSGPEQPRPIVPITVDSSPFTYQNTEAGRVQVEILGGNINTPIHIGTDGREEAAGRDVVLDPGESVTVTYTSAPTMRRVSCSPESAPRGCLVSAALGLGKTGVVVYGKRETYETYSTNGGLVGVHIPSCGAGTIHGAAMLFLDRLLVGNGPPPVFNPEFGSCLFKLGSLDEFTLVPGGPPLSLDDAGVELSLGADLVLSIHESPRSRTVINMETDVDIDFGGLPLTSVGRGIDGSLPVDLAVFTPDGRRVQRNHAAGAYEFEIAGARAGDVHTPHQWISLPDDVPVSFVVDASEAVARARASGVQRLDVEAVVSVIHYDANGVPSDVGTPLTLKLDLDHPTSAPVPVGGSIDSVPPATSVTAAPGPGVNGWNNTDVTVTLTAIDNQGGAGVRALTYAAAGAQTIPATTVSNASASIRITSEGVTTVQFFATDAAGNVEAAKALIIRLDRTPPAVQCGVADGAWHASDVTIRCTASDALSGLADPADASFSLSTAVDRGTETANAATSARALGDIAQNGASAGPIGGNRIDKKPPQITISSPAPAANYIVNQGVAASYACTDLGSGVATCTGPAADAARLDTASPGARTFQVNATDKVGNASAAAVAYVVSYKICPLYDPSKAKTRGSTYPIKVRLCDVGDNDLSSAAVAVHAVSVTMESTDAPGTLDGGGNANPDDNFRYDASLGGYIFNLSTSGLASGSYSLNFTAGLDPVLHSASFQVK
jgi:hypothetical protein